MARLLLKRSWAFWIAGVAVVAVTLIFRLPALGWGLPLKYAHIDESVVTFYSLRVAGGEWNPRFFDYPSLFLYILAGVFRIGAGISTLVSGVGLEGLAGLYNGGDAVFLTYLARGLSVLFAVFTVLLLFDMGRRRGGLMTGLGAACFLAVNVLHVRMSHYGMVDVAACFFTLWALDRMLSFAESRRGRDGVEAAFLVGLAAAAKYYPGVLLGPLLLVPLADKHPRPFRTAGLMLAGAAGGFLLGAPFSIFSLGDFLGRFAHLAPKIVGVPGRSILFVPTVVHVWREAGPALFVAGIGGLIVSVREGGVGKWMGIFFLTLFIFFGLWAIQSPHYSLALYPPLALFAMRFVERVAGGRRSLAAGLTAALLVFSIPPTLRELRYLGTRDTRLSAGEWARRNMPEGSRLLRFAHTPEFTPKDPYVVKVDFTNKALADIEREFLDPKGLFHSRDFVLYSSYNPTGDPVAGFLESRMKLVHRESGPTPRFPHHPVVYVFSNPSS